MIRILVLLLLMSVILQAQPDNVEYDASTLDGVDFTAYTTYNWLPFIDSIHTSEFKSDAIDRYVTVAVDLEMQKRGFSLNEETPQLLMQYMVAIDNTVRTETKATFGAPNMSVGMGFGRGGPSFGVGVSGPRVTGHESFQVNYREGSLIIGIVDIENDQVIWRGIINTSTQDKGQLVNAQAVVNDLIPDLFKKFPKVKRKKKK